MRLPFVSSGAALSLTSVVLIPTLTLAKASQHVFEDYRKSPMPAHHPVFPPRIDYAQVKGSHRPVDPPAQMTLHPLHISGPSEDRLDLTFFSDGYTLDEEAKYLDDARKLTDDIVSERGPMFDVAHLLNVWAVFVPSNTSGIGTHDTPLLGAAFGLYRPGDELRGVYVKHHRLARAACEYWRKNDQGGCDQPILLGNDPLYGGLGGEFTVITASSMNGPIVLRHELGHSLIDVGEEYEGGEIYDGVNADSVKNLHDLKWADQLSEPKKIRIEDAKVPIQQYPWYNLSRGPYETTFTANNNDSDAYPTAMLRFSLSSIPYPDHIEFTLNGKVLDLSPAFKPEWNGSLDRRWLEVNLPEGLPAGENSIIVQLSDAGQKAKAGQGGKLLTSLEIIEYGGQGRFNHQKGFVGAFPTYSIHGDVTLRPTNEECLMRNVLSPQFCPVCQKGLKDALHRKIGLKRKRAAP